MHVAKQGTLSSADANRLDEMYEQMKADFEYLVGYPCNGWFDYSPLYRFLELPLNNIGDPGVVGNMRLNTHAIENEVLETFAKLTGADRSSCWGYCTNGGTEGNLYGLFLARELFPEGLVYYSEDTHYSVNKILRCLHIRNIMIRSNPDGRIDLEDLRETIRIHRDVPPIIFANIGTTMKGAVDDLVGINKILKDLAVHRYYIHADAALSGMILPFLENPPAWNFQANIDSIAISGHKMVGAPFPCGVVLAKQAHVDRIARSVEYVGSLDTTLSGSRSAIAPLFIWYALKCWGLAGYRDLIADCLRVADFTVAKINELGRQAWRHPYSNTVVFNRPSDRFAKRWQIAVQNEIAHIITMPHVTAERIERLIAELRLENTP